MQKVARIDIRTNDEVGTWIEYIKKNKDRAGSKIKTVWKYHESKAEKEVESMWMLKCRRWLGKKKYNKISSYIRIRQFNVFDVE